MKKILFKSTKILLWALGSLLGLGVLFVVFATLLTLIPANSTYKEADEGVTIFLASNGLHVDFILPVKDPEKDWTTYFSPEDFQTGPKPYVAIGRGDRGFYLETPTWGDLKVSNVLNALFLPSETILHITYLRGKPIENDQVKSLILTKDQYKNLISYIEETMVWNNEGQAKLIPGYGYPGVNDQFYEAKGTYHLFMTCNDWVNDGLKRIGVKTAIWAPLDKCLLYHRE